MDFFKHSNFLNEILLFYFTRGSSFCFTFEYNFFNKLSRKLEFGKYYVYKCFFRAIFNCRSHQAGIIKLEWWVEAIFLKNSVERGEFMLIEPLKYHVAKNGGTIVKLFLYCSVDGIQAPTEAF